MSNSTVCSVIYLENILFNDINKYGINISTTQVSYNPNITTLRVFLLNYSGPIINFKFGVKGNIYNFDPI